MYIIFLCVKQTEKGTSSFAAVAMCAASSFLSLASLRACLLSSAVVYTLPST